MPEAAPRGAFPAGEALLDRVNWLAALRSVCKGTAGGPDGLRPEFLQSLCVAGPGAERRLADALGAYGRALATGVIDGVEGRCIALSARIVFIPKAQGGVSAPWVWWACCDAWWRVQLVLIVMSRGASPG